MKKSSSIILIVIFVIAVILRFWALGSVPLSPDWDEAALGYNAYSILHTGRDEYGAFLPFVLRSFDDYKPALYSYLSIPSIAVFGLTVFAVRLPSAIIGVLGVVVMYFLVKELFSSKNQKIRETDNQKSRKVSSGLLIHPKSWFPELSDYSEMLALLSAFLLSISPWQIQFSRTGFETNVGLTFNLLVGLLFLKGLKKPWMLSLAALFAGLNLSVYQSERVFTPLLVLVLIIIYRKELFAVSKKYLVSGFIVGVLAVLPMLMFIFTNPGSLARIQGTSLFSQQTQPIQNTIIRLADDKKNNDLIGIVIDNRRVVYAKEVIGGYLSHFDINWLFFKGDNPRHHAPDMGLLYFINLPFLLFGIYLFVFKKFDKKTKYVVFFWLLLAPVPASVTFDVPHAVRTMNMLPMLLIFIAIGYMGTLEFVIRNFKSGIRNQGIIVVLSVVFMVCALFNLGYYLNQYFVQLNYFDAPAWQYGYAQAIPQIEKIQGQYKKIVVSNKVPLDQSYIFFLFYLRYSPQQYQQYTMHGQNLTDVKQIGNYTFESFDWNTARNQKDVLYVGSPSDFPSNIKAKETISYPDGKPAILLVDPKDNI